MKKKVLAALLAVLLVSGPITGISLWKKGGASASDNVVYVGSVESLTGMNGSLGIINRFAGVVESENTWKVNLDSERTVSEILVESGQQVKKGDVLFTYDVEEVETKIEEANLDLERIANEKSSMTANIQELEKERNKASGDQKTTLTLEIQEAQLDLRKKEYEEKQKQNEIDKLKTSVEKSEVVCEIDGIVKSVKKGDTGYAGMGYEEEAFITVLSVGAYQVKAQINEQNLGMGAIMEGMPVIIHSRVDEEKTWSGIVERIDTENASQGNNNYYGGDSMTLSSNYPFYVKLDSSDGLMLGQHVYVEPDLGQAEEADGSGLWLPQYFLLEEDGQTYVWADHNGKLAKQSVVTGEINENTMEVEILEGLSLEDCICWPEEGLKEGMPTVVSADGQIGQSNPEGYRSEIDEEGIYFEEGTEGSDDLMVDEIMTESQSEVG